MQRKLVLLVISVLAVVGCTKRSGDGDGPKGAEPGTFLMHLDDEPTKLNPVNYSDLYARYVLNYLCTTLMTRDSDTYEIKPDIAEKVEVAKDGMSFTYTIRQGVKFSDGTPLTAEDVKASFEAIFAKEYAAANVIPYFEGIAKAEVLSPYVVKFTAKEKLYSNLDNLSETMRIVPKHIYGDAAKGSQITKEATCVGPYVIDKYDKGQSIVIKKNPDWFGWNLPQNKDLYKFEKIRFRFVKQQVTTIEMLKAGQLDYAEFTPEMYAKMAEGPEWGKSVLKVKAENKYPKSYGYIGWNFRKPMWQDRNVRLAMAHLMNRREMIEKFRYGMSLPATGPLYQQSEYADPDVKPIEFDPAKAAELLKKAGWADSDKDGVLDKVLNGKKTDFEFTTIYGNKDSDKYFVMYQSDLKKVGIKLNLQLLEWANLIKKLEDGDFDAAALGWGAGGIDWEPKQIWHSSSSAKGGSNRIAYKNPEVDKLIEKAQTEFDKAKRVQMLRKVYRMIAEDAPYLFLFNNKFVTYGVTSRIQRPKDTYVYETGLGFWSMKSN